jgi:hypothetical protein
LGYLFVAVITNISCAYDGSTNSLCLSHRTSPNRTASALRCYHSILVNIQCFTEFFSLVLMSSLRRFWDHTKHLYFPSNGPLCTLVSLHESTNKTIFLFCRVVFFTCPLDWLSLLCKVFMQNDKESNAESNLDTETKSNAKLDTDNKSECHSASEPIHERRALPSP